jgi:hypothetical protein
LLVGEVKNADQDHQRGASNSISMWKAAPSRAAISARTRAPACVRAGLVTEDTKISQQAGDTSQTDGDFSSQRDRKRR